uniref:Transposase n=1 Tax=Heterorhabditis bacteriophora TaxID=37862 RepID=A0A1I7WPE5_HETBA
MSCKISDGNGIQKFFRREKRSGERAVGNVRKDLKTVVNKVETSIRPPWYQRSWSEQNKTDFLAEMKKTT